MRRNKKRIFLLMLEVGQVGGILRGALCFFSAFPSGPGQSSGKCWFGEGRGPVSAKGAFHRLTILFFFWSLSWKWSRFLEVVVSFFGWCGLVSLGFWPRLKIRHFFKKILVFIAFLDGRMLGCFFGLRSYLESGSVSGLGPSLCCKLSPFHFC